MSVNDVNQQQNQEQEEEHEGHDSKKHMLMMVLCCLLPMVAIVSIAFLFPGAPYLGSVLFLICPLSMVLMMLPNWLSKKKKPKASCH
jgi:uncharacterized membrane protein